MPPRRLPVPSSSKVIGMDGGRAKRDHMAFEAGVGMASAIFRGQSTSFELAFNGFQEAAEAGIIDVLMPMGEAEFERTFNEDEKQMCKGYYLMTPLPRAPTEEEISNIIKAV